MSTRRLTPSISLLLAFEASAKHQSFARAAEELSLTQSAVSRQVATLEDLLEIQLFSRSGKKIALTDAGQVYAAGISAALDKIRASSLQILSFKSNTRALRLALLPTFGSRWLLPRLHRFYKEHPNIVVHIHTKVGEIGDYAAAGVDASVGVRSVDSEGVETLHLCYEQLVPIVSPKTQKDRPIKTARDLEHHLLMHVAPRPQQWPEWLQARGVKLRNMLAGPHFEVTDHLIQAVVAGVGVGLVPKVLVKDELARGQLLTPLKNSRGDAPSADTRHFCLAYPPYNAALPQLVAFRKWLESEAASLAQLDAE